MATVMQGLLQQSKPSTEHIGTFVSFFVFSVVLRSTQDFFSQYGNITIAHERCISIYFTFTLSHRVSLHVKWGTFCIQIKRNKFSPLD